MKKVLFILLVVFISLSANAQVDVTNKKVLICGVKWTPNKDTSIKMDYGFEKVEIPTDENGNEITFNNRISVINYMTLQGWEFKGITRELGSGNEQMKFQKVVSDEEAKVLLKKIRYPKNQ